jgi:MFS transporter, DHA3 family, macrolide efflux protein
MAQGSGLLRLKGMRLFAVIWSGQFFSLLGTYMSQFALSIWAWQKTGEATALALVALFSFGPSVIMFPIAGALVDRWDRKLVMMISDVASGIATIIVFILL